MQQDITTITAEDLLRHAETLSVLKTTFPEDMYEFKAAASAISAEIKRRVAPPEEKDATEES